MSELREAIARHIGQSGWVRPVNGDNERAWRLMLTEADGLLEVIRPFVVERPTSETTLSLTNDPAVRVP